MERRAGTLVYLFLLLLMVRCVPAAGLQLPAYAPSDGYQIVDALPGLTFSQPVQIASPPGETNRLFVVERTGRIIVITNLANPTKTIFLDLYTNIYDGTLNDWEFGLLGLAFHPGYATNGYFFVYRTQVTSSPAAQFGGHDILARFSVSPDNPNRGLESSELRLITQLDGKAHHNAGKVAFGPEGYLFLSLGDEGPTGDDISTNRQAIDKGHFGGILRIDVDKRPGNLPPNPHPSVSTNYSIPRDNPFVGITNYQGIPVDPAHVRTEFYAIGFRNPWQFAFHPQTGAMLAGDVGPALLEEINLVKKGGNYGWPYYQGSWSELVDTPPEFESFPPLVEYWHGNATNEGNAVVGGLFYFGSKIPQLNGKYLFGDFRRGHIWTLDNDGVNFSTNAVRIACSPELTSFAADPRDGEVLISNIGSGQIQKLVYMPPDQAPYFPATLAETGAFADITSLTPNPALIPYEINHPFWSDGAIKKRWFMTPEKIVFDAGTNYGTIPAGAVWMKHFELEMVKGDASSRRRLETRFLVKTNGGVYGVTYRWNAAGTDATLVPEEGINEELAIHEGGIVRTQIWHYPGRAECRSCHSDAGGQALGFNIAQLNRDVNGRNQLAAFEQGGSLQLGSHEFAQMPALTAMNDESRSLGERFKSYVAANCASCHWGYNLNARWDARVTTPLSQMQVVGTGLAQVDYPNSIIFQRVSATDLSRMPPLGRTTVDTTAVEFLRRFMSSLPQEPWGQANIGQPPAEGMASVEPTQITVSGAGAGLTGTNDMGFLFAIPASKNVTLTGRLLKQDGPAGAGVAGLTLRGTSDPNAPFVFAGRTFSGSSAFEQRAETAAETIHFPDQPLAESLWYRLEKEDSQVKISVSPDGLVWNAMGAETVHLPDSFLAGMFVANGGGVLQNNGRFDQFSVIAVELNPPPANSFTAGDAVALKAVPATFGSTPGKVEYLANDVKIGEGSGPDYAFSWTNALAGNYRIVAQLTDQNGAKTRSTAWEITVALPDAKALYRSSSSQPSGNWIGSAGAQGYVIPGIATNLPSFLQFAPPVAPVARWENPGLLSTVLQPLTGPSAPAFAWRSNVIQFQLTLTDGLPHRVRLYCLDFENSGATERVEFLDANDGVILASTTVSNFAGGLYLNWRLRGAVDVRITSVGSGDALLSGIFIDPTAARPPTIQLLAPLDGQAGSARTPPVFEANSDDPDGGIPVVSFFANGAKIAELTVPPYRFVWTNALVGKYAVYAHAVNDFGLSTSTVPINLEVLKVEPLAVFIGADETTSGDWIGKYGSDGFIIAEHATNLPPWLNWSATPSYSVVWNYMPTDRSETRALSTIDGLGRIASARWRYDGWTNQVSCNDGRAHLLSLYFLDYDRAGWQTTVTFRDSAGHLLDEQTVKAYENGSYLTWTVAGDVQIEIARRLGFAVLSGMFLDPAPVFDAAVTLSAPTPGASINVGEELLLHADVRPAMANGKVQFLANGELVSDAASLPYFTRWRPPLVGEFQVRARAVRADGAVAVSPETTMHVTALPAAPAVIFEGRNSDNPGTWRGVYGADGYVIPTLVTNISAHVDLDWSDAIPYSWEDTTADPRGVQLPSGLGRVARVFYNPTNFTVLLTPHDALWHRVTFYCLDWNGAGQRTQLIEMLDPTGELLDSRTVKSFDEGAFLTWSFRGPVAARFTAIDLEAVVSALFLDPVPNLEQWRASRFLGLPEDEMDLSANEADPDGDGISNILEYKLGLDPKVANGGNFATLAVSNGSVRLLINLNAGASDVGLKFEVSTDLRSWVPADGLLVQRSIEPGQDSDRVELEIPQDQGSALFVRVSAAPLN